MNRFAQAGIFLNYFPLYEWLFFCLLNVSWHLPLKKIFTFQFFSTVGHSSPKVVNLSFNTFSFVNCYNDSSCISSVMGFLSTYCLSSKAHSLAPIKNWLRSVKSQGYQILVVHQQHTAVKMPLGSILLFSFFLEKVCCWILEYQHILGHGFF